MTLPRASSGFIQAIDVPRLASLRERIRDLMLDQKWRTLAGIVSIVGGSEAGASARLRELRNDFKYQIDRRRVGESGLHEYRMVLPDINKMELFQ